jgi:hypothetical protein
MMIPLCYGHVTNFIKDNQRAKPDLRIGRLIWRSFWRCRSSGATVHRVSSRKKWRAGDLAPAGTLSPPRCADGSEHPCKRAIEQSEAFRETGDRGGLEKHNAGAREGYD